MPRLVLLIFFISLFGTVEAEEEAAWKLARVGTINQGNKTERGLAMYTSDKSVPGATFRCENGRLFAFLSVEPLDLERMLTWLSGRKSRAWDVEYTFENREPVKQNWVSLMGDKMYLIRDKTTSRELFDAARRGVSVTVQPRGRKKAVTITLPPDDSDSFSVFAQHCGFAESTEI